jgi:hypothetical protein
MKLCKFTKILIFLVVLLMGTAAMAAPFDLLIGDKDGYGFGASDNGTAVWPGPGFSGENYDGRSASEKTATNGAQITDVYSALFPGAGPNTSSTVSVLFPSVGTITSATLTVAMGDFQLGPVSVNFNGIAQSPWNFNDGYRVTKTRTFVLGAAEIAAANTAGSFQLNLDNSALSDYIAFDWFEFSGNSTAVPEPMSLLLLGFGLVGMAMIQRKTGKEEV